MQDLGMKPFVAKFVPWLLQPEQKEHHVAVANDLIQIVTNEPDFFKKVINLKGTEMSLSYVKCFLYLISFSKKVSIFHITCWIFAEQTSYTNFAMFVFSIKKFKVFLGPK